MLTEGRPLTSCRSCTDHEGRFLIHARRLAGRSILGTVEHRDVENEWRAQIERLLDAGLQLSHLDSHQHVHLLPGLWAIYRDLARRYGIPRIRSSYDSLSRSVGHWKPDLTAMQLLALPRYLGQVPRIRTLGIFQSCGFRFSAIRPRVEQALLEGKPFEVMTHPGFETPDLTDRFGYWNARWDREIEELELFQRYLAEKGFSILRRG